MMPGLIREFGARLQRNPNRVLALLFGGSVCVAFVMVLAIGAAVWNLAPDEAQEEFAFDRRGEAPENGAEYPAGSRLLAYGNLGASGAPAREGRLNPKEAPGRGRPARKGDRDWVAAAGAKGAGEGRDRARRGDGARGGNGARGAGARLAPTAGFNHSGGAQGAPQLASASPLGLAGRQVAAAGAAPDVFSAKAWRGKIASIARVFGVNLGAKGSSRQAALSAGGAGRGTPGGATVASTGFGTAAAGSRVGGPGASGGAAPIAGAPHTVGAPGPGGSPGGSPGGPLNPVNPPATPPGGGPLTPQQVTDLHALRGRLTTLLAAIDSQSNALALEALTDMLTGGRADLAAAKAEIQSVRNLTAAARGEFHGGVALVPEAQRAVHLFDLFLGGLDGPDGVLAGFDRTLRESDSAQACLRESLRERRLACVNGHVASALVNGPRERNVELKGLHDLLTLDPSGQALLHDLRAHYDSLPPTEPGRIALDKFSAFINHAKQKVLAGGRKVNIVLADGLDLSVPTTRGYLDVRAASGNGETHVQRLIHANAGHRQALDSAFAHYAPYSWILPPGSAEVADARHGLAEAHRAFSPNPAIANIPWQNLTPLQTNEKIRWGVEGVAGNLGASFAIERIIAAVDRALARR